MSVRTEEQDGLAAALRTLLGDLSGEHRVREVADTGPGIDERLWARLRDVGLVGLAVPESAGGQGGAVADLAVAFEECGRVLACVPLLSVSLALAVLEGLVDAVDGVDGEPARAALARLCAGQRRATLALAEGRRGWRLDGLGTRATHSEDGWVVSGEKAYVLDGATADDLLVVAVAGSGPVLLLVDAGAAGVTVTAVPGLDITRRIASVRLADARATLLADGAGAADAVLRGLDVAAVLLAAEQVGGAQRCLEAAVEYAGVREQFGVRIGSFQAIKHKCADMLVLVESARALMRAAATALDSGDPAADQLASSAKAYCSEAYVACAGENIQIHGGIGFTWEHTAHLYLRRAKSSEVLFGTPAEHRERVLSLIESETAGGSRASSIS
jgi:alkylation response protein AidB-like acyl-CoA dehydrogenase